MNKLRGLLSRKGRGLPGLLIISFAIYNLVLPYLFNLLGYSPISDMTGAALAGVVGGQLGLLVIWTVLGPGRAWIRQVLMLVAVEFLWLAYCAGTLATDWGFTEHREMGASLLYLPLIFLVAQLPLWGLRLATGGRIVHVDQHGDHSPAEGRQFGVRHAIGATLLAAVALSLASSGMMVADADGAETWIALLLGGLMCALWIPFVTRPCIWAALSAKRKGAAALAVGAYTVLMTALLLAVWEMFPRVSISKGEVWMLFAFHASLMAVIMSTLHAVRLCGYGYVSRRSLKEDGGTAGRVAIGEEPAEEPEVSRSRPDVGAC